MTTLLPIPIEALAIEVLIEVPRGSFAKRDARGNIEFLSPLPCPFNYGCVPSQPAPDGDALDALVLGPRLALGQRIQTKVRGMVAFVDAGQQDDKLICATHELTASERRLVLGFFHFYALCKRLMNRAQGRGGATRCLGWRTAAAPVSQVE
jgi:inorganic pyrophosphatase